MREAVGEPPLPPHREGDCMLAPYVTSPVFATCLRQQLPKVGLGFPSAIGWFCCES